ncbi:MULTISPECIES: thioredoxin [Ruminococcus]|uniref:Thioredoxin n=1 Tax=Ruminococcus albus 8 TaxID=246199 RepID=E9SF46_RUMAL|nr:MULTISPECIES: thioredoxin [Ruminococcus]EGC02113.1 thioredoxin [Ruminococcus albus 8]MBQ9543184.1 thioredoxin [Ruminococcus sp.]MBR0529213.1 thioredoxin [Ruminococcus sp.]MCC3350434.1 thioredoxin [Ruminococcus albus 8]
MAVVKVTRENFENEVIKSDKPVLVDFNADWCGPCKMLAPVLEEIAGSRDDVKIVSINVDDEDILAEDYGVSSIPCLVVVKDGKEVKRSIGFRGKDAVLELLR